MFIVSIMFYLFGFERPPPVAVPTTTVCSMRSRRRRTSKFVNKTCLVLLFLVLFKLVSGADLANGSSDEIDDANNDEDDEDEDGEDDDDYDTEDEFMDLSVDKVVSSYDLYKLKRSLLYNYDKGARPLINSQQPIKVFLRIKFVQINHLDEVLQVMTSTVQIEMKWRDEYLIWNASTYDNRISFDPNSIWTPDVTLSNNLNSFKYETHQETYVVPFGNNIFDFGERTKYTVSVSSDGECYWAFPIKLMSVCEFDLDEFPFDKQSCQLDFRSSAYLNSQLLLLKWDTGVDLKLLKVGEFSVLQSEATHMNMTHIFNENLDEESSHIRIRLVMKRKIIFYLNKIVLPYFVFYIVTAFTYALPVESGEKKSYSTSILISAMIYLKDISNYIPKTSILPLLTIYFDLNLILVFICVFITTFVYMFYYYDKLKVALPECIKRLIAPSRYFQHERLLADSHRFFNSNEVKSSLAHINKQLAKVKQNLRTCESYLFSLQAASGNSDDYLANEMLSLVITLKIFILNHNADATVIDPDYLDRATASCLSTNPRGNRDVIYKLSALDQRRLSNFHFINTLENLKLHLVKLERAARKHRLSLSPSQRPPTRNTTEIINLSKSISSPRVKFHSECNIRLDSKIVRSESSLPPPQPLKKSSHRRHHHHRRHHKHHHHHDQAHTSSSPPPSNRFTLSRGGATTSTSSMSSSARCQHQTSAAHKSAMSLLNTLGEYKFQMRSYLRACDAYLDELNHMHKKKNLHYSKDTSYVHEWKYFAIILDRIVLIFFAIVTPICLIIMYLRILLFD